MNLVRAGHYFSPTGGSDNEGLAHGSCQTATVAYHSQYAMTPFEREMADNAGTPVIVNLSILTHESNQEKRNSVIVGTPTESGESFHLSGDCPWKR